MALIIQDGATPNGPIEIGGDEPCIMKAKDQVFEVKKQYIVASNAFTVSSCEDLSALTAHGALKDTAASKNSGKHLPTSIIEHANFLTCLSGIGDDKKKCVELFVHLCVQEWSGMTERDNGKMANDRRLCRTLSFNSLLKIKNLYDSGHYSVDGFSAQETKRIASAMELIPETVGKEDDTTHRIEIKANEYLSLSEVPARKLGTLSKGVSILAKRKEAEETEVKNTLISFASIPGSKRSYVVHVSEDASVTKLAGGGLLVTE